jgi:hypothetical protein
VVFPAHRIIESAYFTSPRVRRTERWTIALVNLGTRLAC